MERGAGSNPVGFTVRRTAQAVDVIGPYWAVRHDLTQGGSVDDVRILHGSNTNLLAQVCAARIDGWSEAGERHPLVRISRRGDEVQVRVAGRLCDAAGKPGPVRFVHTYRYTPWSMKHNLVLTSAQAVRARRFSPTRVAFAGPATHYVWGTSDFEKAKPRYMHIIGPHYDDVMDEVPDRPGLLQRDAARPWNVAFIRRGREGLQWCGDSNAHAWDALCPRRSFRLERTRRGVTFEPRVVDAPQGVLLPRKIELGWYWFLPNIRRLGRPRYAEVAVQTNPFPTIAMLDAWRKRGVDLIRIHNDSDSIHLSDSYWHDGRHPPFGPAKMRQLAAFIRAVHKRGMKIVPYFSGWELSPDTELFARHAGEWFAPSRPGGKKRYTPNGGAGVYGGIMCPDSGWSGALERNIRAAIDELGFDGFYLDWSSPLPCFNEQHRPGAHNGIDGLHDLLLRLRRRYADKLIVIHSGGQLMWLFHHNLADQYVTLEEGKKTGGFTPETVDEYPVTADFMGVGPASAVPDIFLGKDRTKLYRGLVHAALLGVPPYSYYYRWEEFGYRDWQAEVHDPRGLFAAMQRYAAVDWSRYHFYSGTTGVAASSRPEVGVAVYVGERDGILVAGNLKDRVSRPASAEVHLDRTVAGLPPVRVTIPRLAGHEFRFIRFPVRPQRSSHRPRKNGG